MCIRDSGRIVNVFWIFLKLIDPLLWDRVLLQTTSIQIYLNYEKSFQNIDQLSIFAGNPHVQVYH